MQNPLSTAGLLLMKNLLTPLGKSVLITLVMPAGMSASDAAIEKKIHGLCTTALIFPMNKWKI